MLTEIKWTGLFSAAHFIPGHPKCGRLHGHTYQAVIRVVGEYDEHKTPYFIDYGILKQIVMELDHKLLIPQALDRDSHELTIKRPENAAAEVSWNDFGRLNTIKGTKEHFCFLYITDTSVECLARYLLERVKNLDYDILQIEVTLREKAETEATVWWSKNNQPIP